MAGISARDIRIGVNAFDLSGYLKGMSISDVIGLKESSAFRNADGTARTSKSWSITLLDATLSLKGFWKPDAVTGIVDVIQTALFAAVKSIVTIWPRGDTVGNEGMAFQADLSSRQTSGEVDGLVELGVEFRSSVGDEDVVSHHAMTQETAGANGATVDNGAATTLGGAMYLEVEDVGTTMTVQIFHSTDNFGANNVLLASFAAVTVDRSTQRVEITGTINRYTRIVWTQTGNTTFRVGLHRR